MGYEIRHDIPLPAALAERKEWDFKRMEVGSCLIVRQDYDWPAACRAANSVGYRKGWKFRCKWDKEATALIDGKHQPDPHGKIWRTA